METKTQPSTQTQFTVRVINNPDIIFEHLHNGTNLPVTENLRCYILHEITRMNFRSIVITDPFDEVMGHSCYYVHKNILYFAFFGVPSEDSELIDMLVNEIVSIAQAQEGITEIRGPINLPHIIYGWGFAEDGSSQEPFVAADYTNPEYIMHFQQSGFTIIHRIISFDVPLFALPFKPTHDIRAADLSPEGRQEWLSDFVDLQRRLFPKSTQVTPNILPFFDECVEFIQEFGPDNLIVFTHDQGRRIGLGWGTPNCFDMNEETGVCKSILLFGGAIEPEYQRKGVLKQMIGLFATWNAQNGITHGEMPIGEDNAASIHMAKAYGGKQNRSHVIMQIEL